MLDMRERARALSRMRYRARRPLLRKIKELEAMLGVLRYELERLPEDALGVGGNGTTHWWVRDALISQIDTLLEGYSDEPND